MIAVIALLVVVAHASATMAHVPGCLTHAQAANALQSKYAGEGPADSVDDPATCTYYPIHLPGEKPKLALLVISMYQPGLPGWKALAKAACELNQDACPYAKLLTVERDPRRYMRLLHAALTHSGDGVIGTLDGYLPGSTPAFFWNSEASSHGSLVLMYVAQKKRFVSLTCSRGPDSDYPHGWFEECAVTAARLVYINLTI